MTILLHYLQGLLELKFKFRLGQKHVQSEFQDFLFQRQKRPLSADVTPEINASTFLLFNMKYFSQQ